MDNLDNIQLMSERSNTRLRSLEKALKEEDIPIKDSYESNLEQDAGIDFDNNLSVQICLDGLYCLHRFDGTFIKRVCAVYNINELIKHIKSEL